MSSEEFTERRSSTKDLEIAVALLNDRVSNLTELTKAQDKDLRTLVALANKGQGAKWALFVIGGLVGALLTQLKSIVDIIKSIP